MAMGKAALVGTFPDHPITLRPILPMTSNSNVSILNKVAIVTGASGGIGLATARALARAGYVVFGTSRKFVAGIQADGVRMIVCDVRSDVSVADAVAHVAARVGRIDLLVNNAGVGLTGAAEESSIDQVQWLFDTNVYGTIRMTNAVLPFMRQQRSGRIVNLSSILGVIPAPFSAYYSAAKHAVEGYSESLDHEVRRLGIRVVLIEPGMTKSLFDRNAEQADHSIADYNEGRAGVFQWNTEGMKVADKPESVADTILAAVRAPAPKLRYTSGKGVSKTALLRRFVPSAAFDKSLRREMRLP
jgi:NAD(P)-dependent dehydrogenase (short-subunit alcohol dehydrogenase family)